MCSKFVCNYFSRIFNNKPAPSSTPPKVEEQNNHYTQLEKINYDDTVVFIPTIEKAKVIKVYDGDTFTIACRLKFDDYETNKYYRFSVRIRGIDTPELKTKNATEKKLALEAKTELTTKIYSRIVELKNVEYEKYGRILADVYFDGINIGQSMIDDKYAVAYDGKTKNIPKEWTSEAESA